MDVIYLRHIVTFTKVALQATQQLMEKNPDSAPGYVNARELVPRSNKNTEESFL
jgi:hypothetical protein